MSNILIFNETKTTIFHISLNFFIIIIIDFNIKFALNRFRFLYDFLNIT